MDSIFYNLQAAEAHWHELQLEAERERLAIAALKLRREQGHRSRLARYLTSLARRGSADKPTDPHKN